MAALWGLKRLDGTVIRADGSTQWELLRTAIKADGTHYKKAECENVKAGTVVYKAHHVKTILHEFVLDANESIHVVDRNTTVAQKEAFVLFLT